MENSKIMKQAYASLKGKWGIAIATLIIYVLIAIAAGAGPLVFVIAVGFFLFIIPGVIASLMFSQVFFIMAEDDEIGAYDALVKSYNMMKGYKWKFFKINLRIMALAILCIFTLFIGFIWLSPYQYVVFATFYDDIKDSPSFKNQEYLN